MNGSKRKRAQDDEEDYSPQRKQAFTDEVLKERQAEKAFRGSGLRNQAEEAGRGGRLRRQAEEAGLKRQAEDAG